ncbi:hypothetical protein Tco_0718238, partial [Tanacetum coccineum]
TPVVQSCQRDPKALALSLVNQDLLSLKKGNSGPKKFVLSLHKFPAVIFFDDDIEERTSKCVKKFNPYARYSVEHWKNLHAKILYIKRQKEPGKPKEEVYSNSKIVKSSKPMPDYKNLNKNDIEDMYFLCINGKLGVKSYQQKVNLTAPAITFPGIEKHNMYSIISELVYGIIYKNIKKEKRVMRHQEIHKFCDATLKIVLEGLKSYNNDVKHGYVTPSLSIFDKRCYQILSESAHFQNSTIKAGCKSQIELFFVYKDPIIESQDMSTSTTHQQSLADAGYETRPLMLERGSYIPWASRFRGYLNQKRENKKWLNKEIDEGPYEFKEFTPFESEPLRMQKEEDLTGDDLKHYEAEIEAMNLILISIPNDIYNSVDACTTAQAMWQRVEHLMRGTVQNKVDRETHFNNEFDQFVVEPGEALVSVYNPNIDSDEGPSYDFAFLNEIDNNIIFDEPNVDVNSDSVECDNNVQASFELAHLARNAYKEAEK